MFARDGRTLPFVPVTVAAMAAIRDATPKRRPYATATYVALLELCNEERTERVAISVPMLAERVGAGRTAVKTALVDLRAAGVVEVREQFHGRGQIENEYMVIEPSQEGAQSDTPGRETTDPPGRHTTGPRSPHDRPARAHDPRSTEEELQEEGEETRARTTDDCTRNDPREQAPRGFPDELRPHAREVLHILTAVAEQHGAKRVWPLEVGRAIMARPRHPLVATAHDLAGWAVDSKRPVKDVVATYRTFLGRERELAATEHLANDGTPAQPSGQPPTAPRLHERRNKHGQTREEIDQERAVLDEMLAETRASQAERYGPPTNKSAPARIAPPGA